MNMRSNILLGDYISIKMMVIATYLSLGPTFRIIYLVRGTDHTQHVIDELL